MFRPIHVPFLFFLAVILFERVLNAEPICFIHGHANHQDSEYQENDASSDLATGAIVEHELASGPQSKLYVRVMLASDLNLHRVPVELDLLIENARVSEHFVPVNSTILNDVPATLGLTDNQANFCNFSIEQAFVPLDEICIFTVASLLIL